MNKNDRFFFCCTRFAYTFYLHSFKDDCISIKWHMNYEWLAGWTGCLHELFSHANGNARGDQRNADICHCVVLLFAKQHSG